MKRAQPASASVARPHEGAKLHAPAAARNVEPLCALLRAHAPKSGTALEIASGTGQHIVAFASALPNLHWQPTEIDQNRRASIDAYADDAALNNMSPARHLDATIADWGQSQHPKDLIVLINLLHLISAPETETLINEAAQALTPTGILILYGPFKRDGMLTSAGDVKFDADLRSADPAIGYKDNLDILRLLNDAGLKFVQTVDMPANNLAFVARKTRP